jgi:hypothetical protein
MTHFGRGQRLADEMKQVFPKFINHRPRLDGLPPFQRLRAVVGIALPPLLDKIALIENRYYASSVTISMWYLIHSPRW